MLNGQQNQIRDSRERLLEEGNGLAASKDKLANRAARLEQDAEELQMELRNLEAKIAAYTASNARPVRSCNSLRCSCSTVPYATSCVSACLKRSS